MPPGITETEGTTMSSKKTAPRAAEAAKTVQAQAAVKKVAALKTPDLLKSVTDLQVQVTAGLGSIQGTLGGAMNQFEEITLAVAAQEARLKELYDIEAEAQRIEEVRDVFEEARAEHVRWIQERDQGRLREESEFGYQRDLRRRKEQDEFDQKKAARDRELADRVAAVREAEDEMAELRQLVQGYPEREAKAVADAEARVADTHTREHDHALALLTARAEGEQKLHAAAVKALEDDNRRLQGQLAGVNQQLTKALDQVREIAAKAVEGVGAQQALLAMQSTLQGQNAPKMPAR